jgi:hypothetical protein
MVGGEEEHGRCEEAKGMKEVEEAKESGGES